MKMFKKSMLVAAVLFAGCMLFFNGCSDANSKKTVGAESTKKGFDQKDMKSTAKALIQAIIDGDGETYWKLLAPDCKKEMIDEVGSESIAKAAFIEGIAESTNSGSEEMDMKKCLESDAALEEFIRESGKCFVKIKGKWYFNPSGDEEAGEE